MVQQSDLTLISFNLTLELSEQRKVSKKLKGHLLRYIVQQDFKIQCFTLPSTSIMARTVSFLWNVLKNLPRKTTNRDVLPVPNPETPFSKIAQCAYEQLNPLPSLSSCAERTAKSRFYIIKNLITLLNEKISTKQEN